MPAKFVVTAGPWSFLLPIGRDIPTRLRRSASFPDAGFCSLRLSTAARKATGNGIEETSLLWFRSGNSCAFYEFRSHSGRTAARQSSDAGSPIGRGQMARRRTIRDAIEQDDCRFATLQLSAMTNHIGALKAELLRAPTPKPFASHCATRRIPVLRRPLVGARRRGVHYGYQENAGGCHPPGRNTDCRHSG